MKKLLLLTTAAILVITACDGKKTEEHGHDHSDGTHQHDGEVHEVHESGAVQEEFTVSTDTIATGQHDHQHEAGEDHQH